VTERKQSRPATKRTDTNAKKPAQLRAKAVTAATWSDFEKLFAAKGSPSYCWCMAWRAMVDDKKQSGRAARKRAIQ